MKQRIHSKGIGWYIFASNYKDNTDYTYVNLYFPSGNDYTGEPEYAPNEEGKCALDIDIQEAKFTSYKKIAGLTIFKYELLTEKPMKNNYYTNEIPTSIDTIEEDDLPFY